MLLRYTLMLFLNSRVVGIGTIKWGISDKRIVKGVKLSKDDQDVISRKIAEKSRTDETICKLRLC